MCSRASPSQRPAPRFVSPTYVAPPGSSHPFTSFLAVRRSEAFAPALSPFLWRCFALCSALFCTFLPPTKTYPPSFQTLLNSLHKTPGVWGTYSRSPPPQPNPFPLFPQPVNTLGFRRHSRASPTLFSSTRCLRFPSPRLAVIPSPLSAKSRVSPSPRLSGCFTSFLLYLILSHAHD
jgi:hypothetical protein